MGHDYLAMSVKIPFMTHKWLINYVRIVKDCARETRTSIQIRTRQRNCWLLECRYSLLIHVRWSILYASIQSTHHFVRSSLVFELKRNYFSCHHTQNRLKISNLARKMKLMHFGILEELNNINFKILNYFHHWLNVSYKNDILALI